jgi:hypothetical protein
VLDDSSFGAQVGLSANGTFLTAASNMIARIYQFDEFDKPYYHQIGKDLVPEGDQVFLTVSPDGNAVGVSSKMEVSSKMNNITAFLHDHGKWKQIDSFALEDVDVSDTDRSFHVESLLGEGSLVVISDFGGRFRTFQLSENHYVQVGHDLIFNLTGNGSDSFESANLSANGRFLAIGKSDSIHVFILDDKMSGVQLAATTWSVEV